MTNNQLHGKKFEDFIKACGLFPGAADSGRSATATFDIEARFDKILGLPTSIKVSGNNGVALSDARRFFGINEAFRMIVGRYKQAEKQKIFAQIHEFIVTPQMMENLRGELNLSIVTKFHEGLLLGKFPNGQHKAARAWARDQKQALAHLNTQIILNPKIDSKSQRRLQCSVHLDHLIAACTEHGVYTLHAEAIGDFALPIIQNSKKRIFHPSSPS